jgi:hypothetical protein
MLNLMKQIIAVYNWLHNPHETSFLVGITFFLMEYDSKMTFKVS